jgi:hypothetical protein
MVNLFVRSMGASGIFDAITAREALLELIETPAEAVLADEAVDRLEVVMAQSADSGARQQ